MILIGQIAQYFARLTVYTLLAATLASAALVSTVQAPQLAQDIPVQTVAYHSKWSPEGTAKYRCARHGNRVCGPNNPEGARAGCYRNGRLVIPWSHLGGWRPTGPSDSPC